MRGESPTRREDPEAGGVASLDELERSRVPAHVAVIMDGNGRWAGLRGLPRWEGHRAGMAAVREAIEGAAEAGVRHLTLYAFSQENWARPPEEVEALMSLLQEYVETQRDELVEAGIRVTVFGALDRLSGASRQAIEILETATAGGEKMDVHLAISYGGRAEIVEAARALARRAAAGELDPEAIDEADLAAHLLTAEWPDPDLLVRTSGEQRLSNFLLWQLAYAELYVTPVLWPDFTRRHLFGAILDYQGRERRFGLVGT